MFLNRGGWSATLVAALGLLTTGGQGHQGTLPFCLLTGRRREGPVIGCGFVFVRRVDSAMPYSKTGREGVGGGGLGAWPKPIQAKAFFGKG